MTWILDALLLPLLGALYVPCDWLLGWTFPLGPVWGVVAVGVVSGAAVMVLQKVASRQRLLGQCKADLRLLKQRARAAEDRAAAARLRGLIARISAKYMWGALKPALWTVPIIGVVALWCGSRLGFLPLRPGDTVEVVAHFEDGAAHFAHVIPSEGLQPVGPAIAAVGTPKAGEARWRVRAEKEGAHVLRVRHAGRTYGVSLPVAARGGRPPEPVTVFNRETPGQDQLQAVELKLAPGMPEAWWNLRLQWGGLYLAVALLVALPLRFLMKIQ